jgi:hypothetical protein
LLAVRLACFCNVWTCWPTLVPKAGVINQDGGLAAKTQQKGRFHYSELHRVIQMPWYEHLVVMVIVRNHDTAQNYHPLRELKNCGQGTGKPVFGESRPGNSFAEAKSQSDPKGACSG